MVSMLHKIFITLGTWSLVMCLSCDSSVATVKGDPKRGKVLARAYKKKLFIEDIDFPKSKKLSEKDSSLLLNSYVEKWLRKSVLIHNANEKKSSNSDLDRLVNEYKDLLLIDFYKKDYIKKHLDTNVTEKEIEEFYSKNISSFKTEESLVKFLYFKIKDNREGLDKFYENWKNEKIDRILDYGIENSEKQYANREKWYPLDEINKTLPKFITKRKKKYKAQINKNGFEYFLNVLDTRYKDDDVPLELVRDNIKKIILKRRGSKIIDKHIEELYKSEINSNNVESYTEN